MWLQAINRIGVPVLIAGLIYMISATVHLDRRVAVIDRELDATATRIAHLERFREADQANAIQTRRELSETLASLRTDMAGVRADQAAMLRALTRLESLSDRSNGGPR
jgi:hypothetical protein